MRKSRFLPALLALALAACGSSDDSFKGPGPGGVPTTPTTTPASLVVTAASASIPSDGSVPVDISALVRDANNVVVANVPVTLTATSGALSAGSVVTGADGLALALLTTGGDTTPRNITVTARAATFTATVVVAVGAGGGTGAAPASLVLTSSAASIPADGSISANISALVRDANSVVVANMPVTFSATSGALSGGVVATGTDGVAKVTLGTGGNSAPRNITVTARAGSFTSTVTVAVGAAPSSNTVSALTMMSSATTIPSDGSVNATVVAIARDSSNLLMAGVPVSFTASSGGLAVTKGVTDNNGQAVATLTTAGDTSLRNITVTATGGGQSANTVVAVAPTSATTTVNIGNGTGSAFQPNVLGVAVPALSAGGSTSVTVSVIKSDGTLYTSPVSINFNSPCVAAGKAAIQPQPTATTTTGSATVTYAASGCAGSDTITATASVGSQNLSATGNVTVAAATVGSIIFVSATPTNIALKGTGESVRPETSALVFRVRDSTNGAVAGAQVSFALSTTVGGITLNPLVATSDALGNVQTIVNAGTVATPVTVSATVVGSTIGTQSTQLTISTGIPTAGSFSLSESCSSIEGWDYDGTIATITARLADRFSNPAPVGTAVSFQAEGGSILPQCQTATNANEGGVCSVDFRSSNPRPANGRVSLLATAIGEESFTDANGDGAFTNTDTFRLVAGGPTVPAQDIGEPYLDLDESGTYNVGEPFYDFYNAAGSAGVRDSGDGKFNGALCQDTSGRCPDLVADPQRKLAGIGAAGVVILSGSNPVMSINPIGPFTIGHDSTLPFTVTIRDVNGNPMPGGTTVTASASGVGLNVAAPTVQTVLCSTAPVGASVVGVTVFSFSVTSSTTVGTGTFSVTIKTPKGNSTTYTFSLTVT